ncbi:MAG: radical iron-sulfur cluster-binding oxidoreductase [Phycisphaerales bacterium]|nr:radical iron-sulfur cluster-binding oxidoreductase [Phycisphaerales bacterium]
MSIPLTIRQEPGTAGVFDARVVRSVGAPLHGNSIRTVQLNVGLRCNLACRHCHVESSPQRTEEMSWETMKHALAAAKKVRAAVIDITGGAPETHRHFRKLIDASRAAELQVTVRTGLTILLQKRFRELPEFFKKHRVRLVASLPWYTEDAVDLQRGRGVYRDSIEAIRLLNSIGYGVEPTLPLDIIHNPAGPTLPARQSSLECDYKRELGGQLGIRFTQLFTLINMPVGRFARDLDLAGKSAAYAQKLQHAFNPDTLDGLMCRDQLYVRWDGALYDCDFNGALGIPVHPDTPGNIRDFDPSTYLRRRIATGDHCFGCTAGCGSSYAGAMI